MQYIVALDQGTTSARAIVFDEAGHIVAAQGREFRQIYPRPGWVEHDPMDILHSQVEALRAAVEASGVDVRNIAAIGITNQRETTLMWDRQTGETICGAIVWQCRRTAPLVERLLREGMEAAIRERTGLVPDAYFSGTKMQWILQEIPGARERAERGELCAGTVDSFLVYHLTNERAHVTDATNASRTMLLNIRSMEWDEELLRAMEIPQSILPQVVDSSQIVGTLKTDILGRAIPVAALVGDQQSALFGQGCVRPGMTKNTYGTGCFMLMSTGTSLVRSANNLVTTVARRVDGQVSYALEGSVFVAGAAVQWLRDEMGLIQNAAESEKVAASLPNNAGVYFVPAFTGLGAPHWDMYGRGTILGLTRGTGRAHIVRAALESIAYQSREVLDCMARDSGLKPSSLRVDGGASANNFLMQFQADILGMEVARPAVTETTALGAAMLAGRAIGLWSDAQLAMLWQADKRFTPSMPEARRAQYMHEWSRAVERAKAWVEE